MSPRRRRLTWSRSRLAPLAFACALFGLFAAGCGSSPSSTPTTVTVQTPPGTTTVPVPSFVGVGPVGLSREGISRLSRQLNQPIYWAGPKAHTTYELTQTTTGKIFVRYLPAGVSIGDKRANFLTVATYPFRNASAALKALKNAELLKIPSDGLAVPDASYPKSVHLAFPHVDYQIEVYSPSPAHSREVALSGTIRPVG